MAQIEIKGIIGDEYTFAKFVTDYALIPAEEQIALLVDSPGGIVEEGEAIADFIQKHADRFSSISNSGDVASIATNIFLSLPFEKRTFHVSRGIALIHNPFISGLDAFAGDDTTAEGLRIASEEIASIQARIRKYITKQTGADEAVIEAYMKINEPLTATQLAAINFANIVSFKAVALFKSNNMNAEIKQQLTEQKTMLDRILAMFAPKRVVAVTLTDATGNQIEFPDVPEGSMPEVGSTTNAPDGEIVMADGATYVIAGGVITEIRMPEPPVDDLQAQIDALKAENEELKANAAILNAEIAGKNTAMALIEKEVKAIKAKVVSQMIVTEPKEPAIQEPKKFSYNGKRS